MNEVDARDREPRSDEASNRPAEDPDDETAPGRRADNVEEPVEGGDRPQREYPSESASYHPREPKPTGEDIDSGNE